MFKKQLVLFLVFLLHSISVFSQSITVVETSISELQTALENGTATSVELVDLYLARIEAYDKQGPALNSIIRINPRAREQAAELDSERALTGSRSPLHGIPVLIKDNYNTTAMPTTNGSVALANFFPSHNATQVDLLLEAGAIIIAKTNLDEYARGITSIASLVGQTRNPYDIRRVPGGSSGGTAAGVAASFAAIGMGSDTCGSIRIPSAFNNLIGLRPSKGLSSIYGIMPLSHTQDTGGPLARTVEELALVLDLTIGYDSNDAATEVMRSQSPQNFLDSLGSVELQGLRIGKLTSYFETSSFATRSVIEEALDWYAEQGVEIVEVEIPDQSDLISSSGVIGHEFEQDLNQYLTTNGSQAIASVNDVVENGLVHEALAGQMRRSVEEEFDEEAYEESIQARSTIREAIEDLFEQNNLDALAYPTITQSPVLIGDPQTGSACQLSAHSGLPALSMPVGFTNGDLPVGMEILGKHFQDAELLAIAKHYEDANSPRRTPSVTPELIGGQAPGIESSQIGFNQNSISLQLDFELSILTNQFSYSVNRTPDNNADIFAVTLIIDTEEGEALNEPIVLSLMGPDVQQSAGEYFMSREFREAYRQNRLYLRVFADTTPVIGITQQI
jgi:amidase